MAGSTRVVGTLRSEFLDQILTDAALRSLPRRIHPLEPMRPDAIRSAIDGPARLTGISIDAELATRIVNDTGTGAALPLLAYTLAELADGVKRGAGCPRHGTTSSAVSAARFHVRPMKRWLRPSWSGGAGTTWSPGCCAS